LTARETIATYLQFSDVLIPTETPSQTATRYSSSRASSSRPSSSRPSSSRPSCSQLSRNAERPPSILLPPPMFEDSFDGQTQTNRNLKAAAMPCSLQQPLPVPKFPQGQEDVPHSRTYSMSEVLRLDDLHPVTIKRFTAMRNMVFHMNSCLFTSEAARSLTKTADLHHIYQLAEKMIDYFDDLLQSIQDQRENAERIKSTIPFMIELTDLNALLLLKQRASLVTK